MRANINRYLNGEINAVRDEFVLSRERARDAELIYISHPEREQPIYQFWQSTARRKRQEVSEARQPKHIGGKQPYVMLMIRDLVRLMEAGMPPKYAGYILYLVPYFEWGTGRLICGRKKRSMIFDDLVQVWGVSRVTCQRVVRALKEYGIISHTTDGYYVSRKFAKKGGAKAQ